MMAFRRSRCPLLGLVLLLAATAAASGDDVIDSPMDTDPQLPTPRVVKTFPEGLAKLWAEALGRPEVDYKCQAAQAIALAHRRGMTGLNVTVGPLVRELDRPDQHPAVRLAVARALVALDAREAAPQLLRLAQAGDTDLRELVEPALAKWGYRPARAVWLDRLGQPPPHRRDVVRAIRCLAAVAEPAAAPRLRELALSPDEPPPVRLEAARALAVVRRSGSEGDAERLAADGSAQGIVGRLVAASLLLHHDGEKATQLLQRLARDAEAAVAAVALARLVEIDPKLALPALDPALASPDANVRSLGVEVLFRLPSEEHVRRLADRLADPHPGVRAKARRSLHDLAAKPGLGGPVVREGTRVLAARDWRGQEQAAILFAQLDHKPAADRLVQLLSSERAEVLVAAAWGLRRLAVPDTLPAVLDYARRRLGQVRGSAVRSATAAPLDALDRQFAQLAQFFGQSGYKPADQLLRQWTPLPPRPPTPSPVGPETRAAAFWALGMLHAGAPVPELVSGFEGRVKDTQMEDRRVRRMAAIALGLMKAKDALPTLRPFTEGPPSLDPVQNASIWAVAQITGAPVPPPGTIEDPDRDWFLVPLK